MLHFDKNKWKALESLVLQSRSTEPEGWVLEPFNLVHRFTLLLCKNKLLNSYSLSSFLKEFNTLTNSGDTEVSS